MPLHLIKPFLWPALSGLRRYYVVLFAQNGLRDKPMQWACKVTTFIKVNKRLTVDSALLKTNALG
jgi:hypothetical protein